MTRRFPMLVDAEKQVSYAAGETIFHEGDPGKCMYVVASGEVEIVKGGMVLARLAEGEIFGEMALIDAAPRSAAAVAKTDCGVVPIDEYEFFFLVQHKPYFVLDMMRLLVERIRLRTE